jgi:hypothetical protein
MTDPPIERKVKALTGNLKTLHNQLLHENVTTRIIADRARTLDQIKRLYAVVMAFALTTSVANAYLCERALETKTLATRLIIFGPVFCLGSILILFCLGAERFLDLKYVQLASKRATWKGLALDLAALGATAGVFVVLANSFQPPPPGVLLKTADLALDQSVFLFNLVILCTVDVICLLPQYLILKIKRTVPVPAAYSAHGTWLVTNAVMLVTFFSLWYYEPRITNSLGVAGITTVLVIVHLGRFLIDFGCGFKLYYPSDELPDPNLLLKESP